MNERGFSLLESVLAILILSVVLASVVPVWMTVRAQEQLSAKLSQASRLAVEQIERMKADARSVEPVSAPFQLAIHRQPDPAGQLVEAVVSFTERGEAHEVRYQAIVPTFAGK